MDEKINSTKWRFKISITGVKLEALKEILTYRERAFWNEGAIFYDNLKFENIDDTNAAFDAAEYRIGVINELLLHMTGVKETISLQAVYNITDGYKKGTFIDNVLPAEMVIRGVKVTSVVGGNVENQEESLLEIYDKDNQVLEVVQELNENVSRYTRLRRAVELMFDNDPGLRDKYKGTPDYNEWRTYIHHSNYSGKRAIHAYASTRPSSYNDEKAVMYVEKLFEEWIDRKRDNA